MNRGEGRIFHGDCRAMLPKLDAESFDACVTDPPYELGFMGRSWDRSGVANDIAMWREVLRVLKPGAHLLAFGGTRTRHRMVCAVEDAGFEIRDEVAWTYGQGFPKSRNLDGEWDGWGTALKPAWEPVLCSSKPVTVAQHFSMIVDEITTIILELCAWSGLSVSDAAKDLIAIQVRSREVAGSVLDGARMRSLESIGIAQSAARSSTFSGLVSLDLIRTRGCSALSHVRQSGSEAVPQEMKIRSGEVDDILTRLMVMSTSVMVEGISENTVLSWKSISEDLFCQANKFTIEMATKLTTVFRTLNSSLLPNIIESTGGLSPEWEPIVVARKPLSEKTVEANVARWGTGALNIGACRIGISPSDDIHTKNANTVNRGKDGGWCIRSGPGQQYEVPTGRWPANLIHDGSQGVLDLFPDTANNWRASKGVGMGFHGADGERGAAGHADSGSAARFFYCAKASAAERAGSKHPTVKPRALMRYLCRLVMPPGGTVLDPFAGSGSTLYAALDEGFSAVGIELEAEYAEHIAGRLTLAPPHRSPDHERTSP